MEPEMPYNAPVVPPTTEQGALQGEMTSALAFLREGVPAAVRRAFGDFLPEIAVLPLKGGKNGGWAVEPTRVFMLGLLSYLREEALQRGLLLRTHGQDMPVGNAGVSSTRIVQVTTPSGVVLLDGVGVGEALTEAPEMLWNPSTRRKEATGVMLPDENAARTAETRALKRAVEVLGGAFLAQKFISLSRIANEVAARLPGDVTGEAVKAELLRHIQAVQNGKEEPESAQEHASQAASTPPAPPVPQTRRVVRQTTAAPPARAAF